MARTDTLPHFLTDVADAIREKTGESGTIQASSFDTAIANISGGSSPKTVSELNETILETLQSIDTEIENLPSTYEGLSDNNITLYTPNANNKKYVVRYRNGGYQIIWFADCVLFLKNADYNKTFYVGYLRPSIINSGTKPNNCNYIMDELIYEPQQGNSMVGYLSGSYSTLEELTQALQNNSASYSSITSSYWGYEMYNQNQYFPLTNMVLFDKDNNMVLGKKVSTNETIEVIQ